MTCAGMGMGTFPTGLPAAEAAVYCCIICWYCAGVGACCIADSVFRRGASRKLQNDRLSWRREKCVHEEKVMLCNKRWHAEVKGEGLRVVGTTLEPHSKH